MVILYNLLSYSILSLLSNVDYIFISTEIARNENREVTNTSPTPNNKENIVSNDTGEEEYNPPEQPSSNRGRLRIPTGTETYLWEFRNLEGWELDENGRIKITDPEKFEESLKRRQQKEEEEKATRERLLNPPKEPKRSFPTPFFLHPWGGIASIPIFLIILGISVYILKCRDAKRMKK